MNRFEDLKLGMRVKCVRVFDEDTNYVEEIENDELIGKSGVIVRMDEGKDIPITIKENNGHEEDFLPKELERFFTPEMNKEDD